MDQVQTREPVNKPAPGGPPLTPETVFKEYAPRIYSLARRMLGNDADAEDVTQNVLLQMVRKLDTFRGEAAFPTWLHRVTANAALNYRRQRAAHEENRVSDLDQFTEEGQHRVPPRRWTAGPDKQVLDKEMAEIIEKAVARMPPLYRDVYVLADVEGLPNADIADMLGISVMAVKSRLHRARLWMREALAPHFEEAP